MWKVFNLMVSQSIPPIPYVFAGYYTPKSFHQMMMIMMAMVDGRWWMMMVSGQKITFIRAP